MAQIYGYSDIIRGVQNPRLVLGEFRNVSAKLTDRIHNRLLRIPFELLYGSGFDIMEEDWDNLIILDACRFDYFSECSELDGEVEPRISIASASGEFIEKTYIGNELHDTIYVGGNMYMEEVDEDVFHRIVKTYSNSNLSHEGWHPESVFDAAVKHTDHYHAKRQIIHFMQPHRPYIGEKADQLRTELQKSTDMKFRTVDSQGEGTRSDHDLVDAYRRGHISTDDLELLYRENLELVLEYVDRLQQFLDGKTVVTADHGEMLGERTPTYPLGRVGHANYVYCLGLRKVPWHEFPTESRREIISEPPVADDEADEETVEDNLRALGYLN